MFGGSLYIYAKEDKETKALNEIQREKKARRYEKLDDEKTQRRSRDGDKCVSIVRGGTASCTNPRVVGSAPKLTGGHLRGRISTILFLCLVGR
jgi:hypothetical protein